MGSPGWWRDEDAPGYTREVDLVRAPACDRCGYVAPLYCAWKPGAAEDDFERVCGLCLESARKKIAAGIGAAAVAVLLLVLQ